MIELFLFHYFILLQFFQIRFLVEYFNYSTQIKIKKKNKLKKKKKNLVFNHLGEKNNVRLIILTQFCHFLFTLFVVRC